MTVGRIPSVEGGIQPTIVTTKGDIIVATGNASLVRQGVGANGTVLTANSAQADGVEWLAPDPLTTKGDLFTYSTTEARLGVGANDTVLTADSTTGTGLKWALPASGGMTLLSTTTLTGTSVTISSINQGYTELLVLFLDVTFSANSRITIFANNSTTRVGGWDAINASTFSGAGTFGSQNNANQSVMLRIPNYTSSTNRKIGTGSFAVSGSAGGGAGSYFIDQTAALTSLVLTPTTGGASFTAGTVLIYGVK